MAFTYVLLKGATLLFFVGSSFKVRDVIASSDCNQTSLKINIGRPRSVLGRCGWNRGIQSTQCALRDECFNLKYYLWYIQYVTPMSPSGPILSGGSPPALPYWAVIISQRKKKVLK